MKPSILMLVATSCFLGSSAWADDAPRRGSWKISHCLVSLIDDVEVPAEKAGVLASLKVREGDLVEHGNVLGELNKAHAELQRSFAIAEHEVAKTRAGGTFEIQFAEAALKSATIEFQASVEANRMAPRTVSVVQLDKLNLAVKETEIRLAIERLNHSVHQTEVLAAEAKAGLAEADLNDLTIRAPVNGEIVEILRRPGEWVEAGKSLVRLVRLDLLRVEGFVKFSEHSPSEVFEQPVRATIVVAGGKQESFSGRVTYVNPLVQPGGEYRIWAEVENRLEGKQWLLRPGLETELEIGVER